MNPKRSVLPALFLLATFPWSHAHGASPVGTAFTYQGQLKNGGASVTDVCTFEFTLWDAATNGSLVAGPVQVLGVSVEDGLFETLIDFGSNGFTGDSRWLEIGVQCSGDAGSTTLGARQAITPTPYALYSRGAISVINVREFGAVGDCDCDTSGCTGANDTLAIKDAANAVPDEGGILYFPPGKYCVRGGIIFLKSHTWVLGAGSGSVLVRHPGIASGTALLEAHGKTGIRVTQMAFDVNRLGNFSTALEFGAEGGVACSEIVVDSCRFTTTRPAVFGDTLPAVLSRGVRGLWIANNRIDGLQIVAGGDISGIGGGGGPGTFILNNHISNPHNYAISYVAKVVNAHLTDAVIANNVIEEPTAGGIFVGTDGDGFLASSCKRIQIVNNIISGSWHSGNSFGIKVRAAIETEDILIDGNVLDNTATDVGGTYGIQLETPDSGPVSIKSVSVTQNSVRNFDQPGIWIVGPSSGVVVSGNRLEKTRGIRLQGGSLGPIRDAVVTANFAEGNGQGLHLLSEFNNAGPVLVGQNVFKNHTGFLYGVGILLEAADGFTVSADIVGNKCYDDQGVKTQKYGVEEKGLGSFDTRYLNNDFRDNDFAAANGVGSTAVVSGNLGWRTENSSTGTINFDLTSVTLPHELDVTPAPRHFAITPTGGTVSDPGLIWVSDVNSATFTVNCTNAPGEDLNFGWHVVLSHN